MRKQVILGIATFTLIVAVLAGVSGGIVTAQQATPAATAAATKPAEGAALDVPGSGLIKKIDGELKALNGAGATFPAPLYTKWFSDYEAVTGVKINYQPIGSGGGIKGISDQTIDFGATDGPMTDEQLKAAKGGNILHIATALGGVVPVYNIPEVTEPLKFTPDTLALAFLGPLGEDATNKVEPLLKWNDPRLVKDNPQLAKIDKQILIVHRSDGSGTTNIWTSYLSAVNAKWAKDVGAANAVNWPVGLGGKGNSGVAGYVKQASYTLGYVEEAYAVQTKLQTGVVQNKAGKFVASNATSVSAAAAGVKLPDDYRVKIVNAEGDAAYPIAGFTWLLVYENQTDPAKALAITRVLWWATHDGQKTNATLGYAPLPKEGIALAEKQIKKIMVNGKPALPAELAK